MARYKLHADHYLGRVFRDKGSIVDWDGVPSLSMEPLDEEGLVKVHALLKTRRGARLPYALKPLPEGVKTTPPKPKPEDIDIPDGWRDFDKLKILNLARRLGAPFRLNTEQAIEFIANEEAKRAPRAEPEAPAPQAATQVEQEA